MMSRKNLNSYALVISLSVAAVLCFRHRKWAIKVPFFYFLVPLMEFTSWADAIDFFLHTYLEFYRNIAEWNIFYLLNNGQDFANIDLNFINYIKCKIRTIMKIFLLFFFSMSCCQAQWLFWVYLKYYRSHHEVLIGFFYINFIKIL